MMRCQTSESGLDTMCASNTPSTQMMYEIVYMGLQSKRVHSS